MTLFNIEERGTGRQANNLPATSITEAVRPWFADVAHVSRVSRALTALASTSEPERRWAQDVLGVQVRPVA